MADKKFVWVILDRRDGRLLEVCETLEMAQKIADGHFCNSPTVPTIVNWEVK